MAKSTAFKLIYTSFFVSILLSFQAIDLFGQDVKTIELSVPKGETAVLSNEPFSMECVIRTPAPARGYSLDLMRSPENLRVPTSSAELVVSPDSTVPIGALSLGNNRTELVQDGDSVVGPHIAGDEMVWRIVYILRIYGPIKGEYSVPCPTFSFAYSRPGSDRAENIVLPEEERKSFNFNYVSSVRQFGEQAKFWTWLDLGRNNKQALFFNLLSWSVFPVAFLVLLLAFKRRKQTTERARLKEGNEKEGKKSTGFNVPAKWVARDNLILALNNLSESYSREAEREVKRAIRRFFHAETEGVIGIGQDLEETLEHFQENEKSVRREVLIAFHSRHKELIKAEKERPLKDYYGEEALEHWIRKAKNDVRKIRFYYIYAPIWWMKKGPLLFRDFVRNKIWKNKNR